MSLKFFLSAAVIFVCVDLFAAQPETQHPQTVICGNSPRPMRVIARHIEPGGIGYSQGYTTVEGFFPLHNKWDDWMLFLDTRVHIFNSGRPALNAGVGTRYLTDSRIWGLNAYYDYRKTKRCHYNQIAFGFEALGDIWDFRCNGYIPVGRTHSDYFDTKFFQFLANEIIVSQKYQYVLAGFNAEVGVHVDTWEHVPLYFTGGPYYLTGKGSSVWGGQAKASIQIYDWLILEGNVSYDHLFKWIGQGQIGFNFSFGGRKKVRKSSNSSTDCTQVLKIATRSYQPVERFEIMPVDTGRHYSKAIDPTTGQPYTIWFVDNLNFSEGTHESSFSTLAAVESVSQANDIIYVYPGGLTSDGLPSESTLKESEPLLTLAAEESASQAQDSIHVYPGSLTSDRLSSEITLTEGKPLLTLGAEESASQANKTIYVYPAGLISEGLTGESTLKDGRPLVTLAAAEGASEINDIIYIYPGDLTSKGQSNGITLKDGQQLLAATTSQTLMTTAGPIVFPAQAPESNPPLLTNGAGAVVTLGDNNVVSGFYIRNTNGPGILARGSNNATLTQNFIEGDSGAYHGIQLDNVTGTVNVSSNTIMHQSACVNIDNSSPISNASYLFTNNELHPEDGSYGFNIAYTEGSNNYFLSANNNFYSSKAEGINVCCSNTIAHEPNIFDITNCNIENRGHYAVKLTLNNDSIVKLNVKNSLINSYYGVYAITNNQSQLIATVINNSFNVHEYAMKLEPHNSSYMDIAFTDNSIACYDYGIYINPLDTSALAVNISNNVITSYEYPLYTHLEDSANLTGMISNNALNSLYYGIYTNAADSSNFAANINNNVINSAYYHMEMYNSALSGYSGDIISNTFIGQDSDDTIYWNINTSGTVSSTIKNNLFTGNYRALDLSNNGSGTTTLQILNNTIQNSSHAGISFVNSGANCETTISGNTFQGFGTNAVNISNTSGQMSLKLNNNTSNPYPNAYVIDNADGILNLVAPTGNMGQLQISGIAPDILCP